jgi:hypothetical protein
LQEQTAILVAEGGVVRQVSTPYDEHLVAKLHSVFGNAISRSRTTWRVALAMTVSCFALIAGMVLSSMILSMITGKSSWLLIFGGASVPLVIGTLIWKPLDKTFCAAAISQQIELIHIQVEAVFSSTPDVTERVRICQDGIRALQGVVGAAQAHPKSRRAKRKRG